MTATLLRLFVTGALLFFVAAATTQQSSPNLVASVTQLMRAMAVPASNALFDVARTPPKDDSEWAAIEDSAALLAESGNLLMMPGRAENTAVWTKTSQAMVDAGATALRAAQARNLDAIIEAGNQIVDACESCHEKHWIR